jgi:hypothetical protein
MTARVPSFRGLVALVSMVLLGLVAAPSVGASVPQPPLELPSAAGISAAGASSSRSEWWIVGGVPGERTARIAAAHGALTVDRGLGTYRIARDAATGFATALRKAGRLVYAEPDVRTSSAAYPLDALIDQQWWLNRIVSPSDVTPPAVSARSPLIALIEEALDPLHPDLTDANLTGARSKGPEADTHGTAVAAIAGSPGEMNGIRGVWPGARMRLFASGLRCSTASKAVMKAARVGAAVINMSYTFPANACFTHLMATQFAIRSGSLPVAASGNSGNSGNAPQRPAVDPHVISVGAIDSNSVIAPFSTRNSGVDLVAPGVSVLAPIVTKGSSGIERGWAFQNGTSFAAPMVSAAAAWMTQARPRLGNLQIGRLLTGSATDLGVPGRDPVYGEGLLSIERGLIAPSPPADPYEPNDDIPWLNGSLIKKKSPYLWRAGKGKRRVLKATLSLDKDPADVYRVMIPARRAIIANVAQIEGDVVLSALKPRSKTIVKPGRNLIVRSNRPYPKTEGIFVRNLKRKPQTIFLAITPSKTQLGEYSRYKIMVARR